MDDDKSFPVEDAGDDDTPPGAAAAAAACSSSSGSNSNSDGEDAPQGGLFSKKRDPDMPRLPPSAFLLYVQATREQMFRENPDLNLVEVTKKLGRNWKDMADDEKQRWQSDAATARAEYNVAMEKYKATKAVAAPAAS